MQWFHNPEPPPIFSEFSTNLALGASRASVDMEEIFVENFQDTYVRPRNPWDLNDCLQKSDEALRHYIWRFSRKCNLLTNLADVDVIDAFILGTTDKTLVHKLRQNSLQTAKEPFDIAISHGLREEAVGAIFDRSKRKVVRDKELDKGVNSQLNTEGRGSR